jgi:hypothetical protein
MRKLAIGVAAACLTCAAVMPVSAQGLWIGAPGFGVGIGVAPAYAYEPYYGGYVGTPYVGTDYAYEPSVAYSTYAYEPVVEYDTYAYGPAYSYGAYAPRAQVYAYERSDAYRYAPRYSRGYAYSPEVRTARGYTYADTRGVIRRDRHRASELHNAGLQQRTVIRDRSQSRAEKRNVTSRQIKPEASGHLARGSAQDLRPSKRPDTGRVRTRTDGY